MEGSPCVAPWPPTLVPTFLNSVQTPGFRLESHATPLVEIEEVCRRPSTTMLPTILDVGQGGTRYHLPVTVNGLLVSAVVDTGADVTVLSDYIADQLTELAWNRPAQLQNFTGGSTTARGPEAVKLAAGRNTADLEVYRVLLLGECILCNDAFTALGAVINCRTQQSNARARIP